MDPLVHHPAPRSRRSTRTLGQRSWSTLPLFWLLLILAFILLCPSASPSYTPSCSRTTASLSLERSWSATLVPQFTRFSLSTPAQNHPGPSPSFPCFRVLDFNRILFLASPPPCNLITSPPPHVPRTVLSASHVVPGSPSRSPIYLLFSCDLPLDPP